MKIIIADDDRLVCDSLKIILGAQGIEVCGVGADGDQAARLYEQERPDVALLDIQMPGRDGLWAAEQILSEDPAARVVFLTTFSDDEYIVRALKLGARGYLIKTDVAAIPPALARPAAFACLTDREFEVARLVAEGLDNKEIAVAAYMGEGTVRNHISSVLAKLGLRNRTQIAIAYLRG